MKLSVPSKLLTAAVALSSRQGGAFQLSPPTIASRSSFERKLTSLYLSSPSPDDLRRIMEEESNNPATLAASAERMKSMTPEVRGCSVKALC